MNVAQVSKLALVMKGDSVGTDKSRLVLLFNLAPSTHWGTQGRISRLRYCGHGQGRAQGVPQSGAGEASQEERVCMFLSLLSLDQSKTSLSPEESLLRQQCLQNRSQAALSSTKEGLVSCRDWPICLSSISDRLTLICSECSPRGGLNRSLWTGGGASQVLVPHWLTLTQQPGNHGAALSRCVGIP